jgi:hypothetical protein
MNGLTGLTVEWPWAFLRQAPIGAMTTPEAISSVTRANATNWPRSLWTRTYCPSLIPRSAASCGCMVTACSPWTRRYAGWSPALELR